MEAPNRALTVTIVIGADSEEALRRAFRSIDFDFHANGIRDNVSGGPDSGWIITTLHNPEMTHEKYHEGLKNYLDWLKENQNGNTN